MAFVQISRGSGGWPLTVFLTPNAKPIFGSTYFPPRNARGMTGLFETLDKVLEYWRDERANLEAQAETWAMALQRTGEPRGFSFRKLDRSIVGDAILEVSGEFDPQFGGFGFDPKNDKTSKFPQASILELLCHHLRNTNDERTGTMLSLTLHRMNQGGIWDCVGGGFHRYTVDRYWRVPHFEKMLYDNAQLARVYLEAFELTNDRVFRRMAMRTFDFIKSEMTSPEGGFYTALDAESEHEEGRYYVWTKDEVRALLSPPVFEIFAKVQMRGEPNFSDNRYVLQLGNSLRAVAEEHEINEGDLAGLLEQAAAKLLMARSRRPRPLLNTNVLTDWNGLMIGALADGYRILGTEAYLTSAVQAANLLLEKSRTNDGRLLHVYAAGSAKIPGYLDDYAFFLNGLLALHQATNDERWLVAARSIADTMNELFWDESRGGYFQTDRERAVVLSRLKPMYDMAVPSGNSVAALALVKLARATGDSSYADRAGQTIAAFAASLAQSPGRWPLMVRALGEYLEAGYPVESLSNRSPAQEPQLVRARAVMQEKRLTAGRPFQIDVAFEIERQWHIYANPSTAPQYSPTTLQLSSELPIEQVKVEYPKPRSYQPEGFDEAVAVYTGGGRIRLNAKLNAKAPAGPAGINLLLQYQACNDDSCLAPQSVRITVPVEIVAATDVDSASAVHPEIDK
jgi:uncharacterized protein YyaL (SSP411 family)